MARARRRPYAQPAVLAGIDQGVPFAQSGDATLKNGEFRIVFANVMSKYQQIMSLFSTSVEFCNSG
jgi:hypothetical protein